MPENVIDCRKGFLNICSRKCKIMTLDDFFSLSEMNSGLTAPARVRELVAIIKIEGDSIMKSVSDATRQWFAIARTIAATENKECLDLFIQLYGLHFISKWLKDARNLSNGTSVGFVEEITHLLLALEKLHMEGQKSVLLRSGVLLRISLATIVPSYKIQLKLC